LERPAFADREDSKSELGGIATSLFALAFLMLLVAPLGMALDRRQRVGTFVQEPPAAPLRKVLGQAMRHRGYLLLTLGFFTCGFQLAFIATHLPEYLTLCHMPIGLGATALALIGLFNMAGSWGCGWLGGRFRQHHVLGWLYLIRSVTIGAFFLLPKTSASVVIFAAVMGLTWLGTVPLTSGLVAKVFGTRHLGSLFGVCFLSHQIGSFLGAWLGGLVFDLAVGFLLLIPKTRIVGAVVAVGFHLINAYQFEIGNFPWLMIGATILFFSPDWPRSWMSIPKRMRVKKQKRGA